MELRIPKTSARRNPGIGPPPAASPAPESAVGAAHADPHPVVAIRELHKANEQCIEMMVHAARTQTRGTLPLIGQLREALRQATPEMRGRAARRPVLLVDMQFNNLAWWQATQALPNRVPSLPSWRGAFPRPTGILLARSTLLLAWHSVRADKLAAQVVLGMSPTVADLIWAVPLTEVDRIVERGFRHARPRWEDRPAMWHHILAAAKTEDIRRTRDADLRAIQLVMGRADFGIPARAATAHGT